MSPERQNPILAAIRRLAHYLLSLPERMLRALAALTSGVASLLTENLLPASLRKTTTYRVTIGMAQQFLMERVAGIRRETTEAGLPVGDDYVQRKMAGTALEATGLFAIGFSPLWVLAIAGDVAGGSKTYLRRLVKRLRETGVIAPEANVDSLTDLLEAVQDASRQGAVAIDMPPLSRADLALLAEQMSAAYLRIFDGTVGLLPRLDEIWEQMTRVAKREDVPVEQVGGALTVSIAGWGRRGFDAVVAIGQAGAEMFDDHILDSYRQTLASIDDLGLERFAGEHLRPFLQSARDHFDARQLTWTERQLAGRSRDEESSVGKGLSGS
jgi:hypothetical protein